MHFVKYFAAPWAAFIFYALASFISGNIGLSAYEEYTVERKKQLENLEELRKINMELAAKKEALNDPDTIALEAINIGYGRDGESYVHIEGFNGVRKQQLQAGEIFRPIEPDAAQDELLKIYAVGIFIVVLGTLGVTDILRFIRNA